MHSSQHRTNSLNCRTNLKIFLTIETHLKLPHGSEKKKKNIRRSNSIVDQGKYGIMHHISGMIIVNFLQILLFCVGELFLICKLQSDVILICYYCTVDIPHFFFSHPFFVFIIKEKYY